MKKLSLKTWTFNFLLILLLSCNQTKPESEKCNLQDLVIINDTCKVVSQSSYFYTCYGEFRNPIELQNYYAKQFSIKKENTSLYNDSSMIDTLYRIVKDNSFIKYTYANSPDEKELMQIVSARIIDSEFTMTNGLKIGMDKSIVLKILFGKKFNPDLKKIDNYQIITALEGLWINLGFNNNKLNKIDIYSDYQANQK
jgi:hypothetical protein